jgi:hypothetical protein
MATVQTSEVGATLMLVIGHSIQMRAVRQLKREKKLFMRIFVCAIRLIFNAIKSRRMRWVRHVVRMGEVSISAKIFVKIPQSKKPQKNLRTWILEKIV